MQPEGTLVKPLLLLSVVCLALGVGLIVWYCSGATGISFGDSLSTASLHLDITTTGPPVLIGVPLTLLGALLLIIAWFLAIFGGRKQDAVEPPPTRRDKPFQE
jgi:hypothetical protein